MNSLRFDEPKDDKPPYSRLFVVCSKELRESDVRQHFERMGEVEDVYMPKDRLTGESRGVAYVKYAKTSSAAMAIEALHQNTIPGSNKPLKVLLAVHKNSKEDLNPEKINRLFIKIPKEATVADIKNGFSEIAQVDNVFIQKHKDTNTSKGLAYVQFESFLDAAKAFEQCDRSYKPMFATPRQALKRGRDQEPPGDDMWSGNPNFGGFSGPRHNYLPMGQDGRDFLPMNSIPQGFTAVSAMCTPMVSRKHLESLFNLFPGMTQFNYFVDNQGGFCKANVIYQEEQTASYVVQKLNNFEFPSGEIVQVKPSNPLSKVASDLTSIVNSFKNAVDAGSPDLSQLADAIAQASSMIKVAAAGGSNGGHPQQGLTFDRNYCSVQLPPVQPMASQNAKTAQRCFIVCKPHPPNLNILRDVFGRFGDLIEVSIIPNKTFGFAKYASARAAQEAMKTLHGATVCGVYVKVLEADDKRAKNGDSMDLDTDHSDDNKRIRLHDQD